ncbi:hypothetical protein [Azospirillum picis]|uniref:Uncharacterized protein n=1 Tax=Azospirillum picis TaxID=488438 RepID=A0ABU0MQR7_9PROT|nr:hypothetical protein [Azospirillum picis]MBP2302241.1 hypothetical protein [Azospirillum picis]MDQ0535820.1 hypothetical protein [Azospirillum picis]
MQNRYRIAWDLTGWAVIDTMSGRLAEADGFPLIGLSGDMAERTCHTLNQRQAID